MGEVRTVVTTVSGANVEIPLISPGLISITDIAHSLSMQCRFNGHVSRFMSVAEHCVVIARAIMRSERQDIPNSLLALEALLHDAEEAFTGDLIYPIKNRLKCLGQHEFDNLGSYISGSIMSKYKLRHCVKDTDIGPVYVPSTRIKELDHNAMLNENFHLNRLGATQVYDSYLGRVIGLDPAMAKKEYIMTFKELTDGDYRPNRQSVFG